MAGAILPALAQTTRTNSADGECRARWARRPWLLSADLSKDSRRRPGWSCSIEKEGKTTMKRRWPP